MRKLSIVLYGCLDDFNEAGLSALPVIRVTYIFAYVRMGQPAGSKKINHMHIQMNSFIIKILNGPGNRELISQRLCFRCIANTIPLLLKKKIKP